MTKSDQQRITQHKRFVPFGTHPNSAIGGTSFMLGTLSEIAGRSFPNSGKG
jgi:hypothetical protein